MNKLKVTIGRSSQCDYTIENTDQNGTVSGNHATISETDSPKGYLFEDHSTNGSYMNGKLIHNESCEISLTDHITLGKTYVLPLEDIVRRYMVSQRQTERKQQPQAQSQSLSQQPQPSQSKSQQGLEQVQSQTQPLPQQLQQQSRGLINAATQTKGKAPVWFWVLYVVSIVIAFVVGLCCF